jgi:hypothetical protein
MGAFSLFKKIQRFLYAQRDERLQEPMAFPILERFSSYVNTRFDAFANRRFFIWQIGNLPYKFNLLMDQYYNRVKM